MYVCIYVCIFVCECVSVCVCTVNWMRIWSGRNSQKSVP